MDRTILLFRAMFLTSCGVAGWYLSPKISEAWANHPEFGSFLFIAGGLCVILADLMLHGVSLRAFSSATFGLTMGLLLATLLKASGLFDYASKDEQWIIHLAIYLTFGYLGTMLALRSNRDEFSLMIPYVRFMRREPHEQVSLLDTSAIIDGRVSELCKSGFLDGNLIVPRFVLDEVQTLADSSDPGKRTRGRYGLDLLNELRNSPDIEVKIHETAETGEAVDARLVRLAQLLDARIVTTDYNLGRVAELQRLRVLNIHLLAASLRPPKIAGDRMRLKLTREGKEPDQGVGFLPDGTMIVVNQARPFIGQEVEVMVSGAIQTTAGRMIFAELAHDRGAHRSPSTAGEK